MNTYVVTVEVDYIIQAESLSEALSIADKNTEHPVIGQSEGSYCYKERIIAGKILEEGK